jgi:hypothetical protein
LRNTPNQDQGVEYNAYSIFNLDNFAALVNTCHTEATIWFIVIW